MELNNRNSTFWKIIAISIVLCISGCARQSYWADSSIEDSRRPVLPSNVPVRVAVMPFDGHELMVRYAAEKFGQGLSPLGFDVVNKLQMEKVLGGAYRVAKDEFDNATRLKLARELGIEGIIVGKIIGKVGVSRVVTLMEVELIDIVTGSPIWIGRSHTNKFTLISKPNPSKSVDATVAKSLKLLKDDLKAQLKAERKLAKKMMKKDKKDDKEGKKTEDEERTQPEQSETENE